MTGNIVVDAIIVLIVILGVIGGLTTGWDRQKTDRAAREFYERERQKAQEQEGTPSAPDR